MCSYRLVRCVQTSKFQVSRVPSCIQVRYVEQGNKPPGKVEQVDKVNMPGFIHPENANEEGYFTQKARQQLEELKKKLEKPKVENTEKKE